MILLNSEYIFYYSWILVAVVFFSTNLVYINISHVFALLLFVIIISLVIYYDQQVISINNEELEGKMKSLLPENYNYVPEYLYLEPDFILLFDSVKTSIGVQNVTNFYKIIKLSDSLLEIKSKLEQQVCSPPKPPELILGEINYKPPNCMIDAPINCMQEYYRAKSYMSEIMNLLNGLILTSKLNQTTEWIYLNFVKRLGYLVKRTLNDIRVLCPEEEEMREKIGYKPLYEDNFEENFNWYNPQ